MKILEAHHAYKIDKSRTLTFDCQFFIDPAHNADRSPVSMFAARLRADSYIDGIIILAEGAQRPRAGYLGFAFPRISGPWVPACARATNSTQKLYLQKLYLQTC